MSKEIFNSIYDGEIVDYTKNNAEIIEDVVITFNS